MLRIVDLRCGTCAHLERDACVERDQVLDCPNGHGPMSVYWGAARSVPGENFTPIDLDGIHYSTRSEWEGYIANLKEAHPGKDVVVDSHNRKRATARAEEMRAAYYARTGVDERIVQERHREVRAKKREQEEKRR